MKSHEVLRQAFKQPGCKRVAAELRLSLSLIHQWSRGQDGRSGARNPLDMVRQLLQTTGDPRLLEWLCAQAGGRFVRGGELRLLGCQECERKIAELKSILQLGDGGRQLGDGCKNHLPSASSRPPARCRWRRPGGRCGLARAR